MSTIVEQLSTVEQAIQQASTTLGTLRGLLGITPYSNGVVGSIAAASPRTPKWMLDPAKKARSREKFRKTMRARRLARLAAQQPEPTAA